MMRKLLKAWRIKLLAFLTPEPELKEDYIDKMVLLIRRDFDPSTQNEIIISVIKKVAELREQDMSNMVKAYDQLQKDQLNLKQVILC